MQDDKTTEELIKFGKYCNAFSPDCFETLMQMSDRLKSQADEIKELKEVRLTGIAKVTYESQANEIKQLKAAAMETLDSVENVYQKNDEQTDEIEQLKDQNRLMRKEVQRFGGHLKDCIHHPTEYERYGCTCGFSAYEALAKIGDKE